MKSATGWKRLFDDPIPLPRGHQLVTLQDAGSYITKLPKAEHEAQVWQAAMEALIWSRRRAVRRYLRGSACGERLIEKVERVFNADRKDYHLGTAEADKGPTTR